MTKLRIAVMGCGRIANSGHLPAIVSCSDEIELAAVVDPVEEKAQAAGREFGARKIYTSSDQALADPDIDAVAICMAHHLHAPTAIQAARAGKHVLVEKPMALSVREADQMISVAREAGVTLMVGQSRRFSRAILESKKRFHQIGRPLNLLTNWMGYLDGPRTDWWTSAEKTGGLLIPLQGSHAVDYILWVMEETPTTVYAQSHSSNPQWEGEDDAVIQMGFAGGAMATVVLSFNAPSLPYERFIVGTEGTMYTREEDVLVINGQEVVGGDQAGANFRRQYQEFAGAIREGRPPMASGEEVRKVIVVLEAVQQSIRQKNVISL